MKIAQEASPFLPALASLYFFSLMYLMLTSPKHWSQDKVMPGYYCQLLWEPKWQDDWSGM
jgi:hypothetical protein